MRKMSLPGGRSLPGSTVAHHSGTGTGVSLAKEAIEESTKEATDADNPSAPKKKRVLRRAISCEPIKSSGKGAAGRAAQRQES